MKRGITLVLLFILLVMPFVIAENETENSLSESSKVENAYKCLENKLGDDCSSSLEDNIFSLLAIGKCKGEILADSWDNECWPKSNCKIKTTAQAILALDSASSSTLDAEEWLFSKNTTPEDIIWYLEIESPEKTICSISYGGATYKTTISEDKQLSSSAGNCLTLSDSDYWLRVSPSCYNYEFEVSCDQQFLTTLLYKKKTSPTIYVSESISSESAEGTTSEKVDFKCFSDTGNCDYEGTLWATLVLDHFGYDISSYMPYLITMADDNKKLIPEAFLYLLTGASDFRADVLLKQETQYWDRSGDKFYDSAVALLPFQYESPSEKSATKNWLLEIQNSDGCWDGGNIRNNAFLLYSIWPKKSYSSTSSTDDCEDAGYYCIHETECEGNILDDYSCGVGKICCDEKKAIETCSKQGGGICEKGEVCLGGITTEASDINYGESCCVGGRCEAEKEGAGLNCEYYKGVCRPYGCEHNEKEASSYSCDYGDICCMSDSSETKSLWWIWLLIILIILVVLAIIFRNRFRNYYYKIKSKFTKTKPGAPGYQFGKPTLRPIQRRITPRRILPPSSRNPLRPAPKKPSEIDDILKKLKDMGK